MDMWSLRPNVDFTIVGSTLQRLELDLAEYNLAGRAQTVGVDFRIDLGSLALGESFAEPRIVGSRVGLRESVDVILNRQSGAAEGWQAYWQATDAARRKASSWANGR